MPEVTIILPVHNGANYLKESIESVLSQDFTDFELHILDDGSEDQSAMIAQTTGDSRVVYSKNPVRFGLFKTLNRGFEEASSSLVRIWAHDDRMLSGSLRQFVAFARSHPSAGLVYSDFYGIDSLGKRTGEDMRFQAQRKRTPPLASDKLSLLLFCIYGCLPGNISTVMLRREAWKSLGGFMTGREQIPEFDLWIRLSEKYDIGFISEKAIELRDHPSQLGKSGQKNLKTIEEELIVVTQLRAGLAAILSEKELDRLWRTERGRQHIHWIARAALRGEWATVRRGWHFVKAYGQPWSQVLFWLVSVNGRFFMPDRHAVFDKAGPALSSAANWQLSALCSGKGSR